MHNDRPAPFSRRRFIAATAGAAVALALPARAAPLLNLQDRKRSLASNAWIEVDPADMTRLTLRFVHPLPGQPNGRPAGAAPFELPQVRASLQSFTLIFHLNLSP